MGGVSGPFSQVSNNGSSWAMNADGSITATIGVAAKGFAVTGTAPVSVAGAGTAAGTFWTITAPAGGASSGNAGGTGGALTWSTGAAGASFSGGANGGDATFNFGAGTGTGRAGGLIVNGQIGIGVNPNPNYDIYLTPTASGSVTRMGIRNDPTWTDAGSNATSYAFSTNTTLALTADAAAGVVTAGYYSQITTPANAFNVGKVFGNNILLQFSGSAVGLAGSTLTGIQSAATVLSTATGNPNELAGSHFDANHYGTGTVPLAFGQLGRVQLGDGNAKAADGNFTSVKVMYAESYLLGIGVTPGVATNWYAFFAEAPNLGSNSATSKATTFWGFYSEAHFNTYGFTSTSPSFTAGAAQFSTAKQGGNTSGSNNNYGLQIIGAGGVSASGGTVNNRAIDITMPSPAGVAGGTNSNIGLYIQGAGGTGSGTVNNWSFRNDSTANSVFAGPVTLGTNIGPTAPTKLRIVPTPTVTLASGTSITWDGVLVDATTLTLSGTTAVTTANGLNLMTLSAPTLTDASAVTVSRASTLAIIGPPVAAGSVTLTTPLSLFVATGNTSLGGINYLAQGAAAVAGGSTANFVGLGGGTIGTSLLGVYFGSGAPSITAPQGSLYLRTEGASNVTRAYINTTGSTTWTAINTVA